MARLYVAISHFHPALFDPNGANGDDYGGDKGATFLVVQPFLTPAGHPDHIPPDEYFATWDATRLQKDGFVLIDEPVARQLHGQPMVPVPFPSQTRLELTLKGQTRSGATFPDWTDDRLIGGTTPAGMAVVAFDQLAGDAALGWPGFAVLSQAIPLVGAFGDLDARSAGDGPQKRAVVAALLALFSQMVKAWSTAPPAPPTSDARVRIWREIVEPQYGAHPLSDTEWWRSHLDGAYAESTRIEWAYRLLIDAVANGPPVDDDGVPISVPRYAWDATLLGQQPGLFLDIARFAGRSYLDAMWDNLTEIGRREPAKLEGTLQRLFGFGERLAWPKSRAGASQEHLKRFMTLRPSLPPDARFRRGQQLPAWLDPTDWLVTNMVSLLGQVFRITPFDAADPPTQLTTAGIVIAGHAVPPSAGLADALNRYFDAIANDAASGVKPNVSLAIAPERGAQSDMPAEPGRLVLFAGREATLKALDASAQPAGRGFAAVGEGLLDLVDSSARFNEGGAKMLPSPSPARRGLFLSDLAASLPAGARTWHRRTAEIEERWLTGAGTTEDPPAAYALRFTEQVHPSEAMVAAWLREIASGQSNRLAFLWIPAVDAQNVPQPVQEVPLAASNLWLDVDGAVLILDPNPVAAGSLAKLLARRPGLPGGSKDPKVSIVFATQGAREPFDLVDQVPYQASIVLSKAPASRLGITSDRLALALAASWTPTYDPAIGPADGRATPLVDQVANTNKLRLTLNAPGGYQRELTDPDALLPLPRFDAAQMPPTLEQPITDRPWDRYGAVKPEGPQACYWLGEYLDQSSGGDDDMEETRFRTWTQAGGPFSLSGYFEHPYGHRVAFTALPVEVRRGVDIVNPAQVHLGSQKVSRIGSPAEGERLPLIEAIELPDGAQTKLQLGLRKDAARHALARYKAKNSSEDFAADLRTYYRALTELRDAIHAGTALLEIESWIFDNSSALGVGKGATLLEGLRCPASTTERIAAPEPGKPLARMFAALDSSFEAFRAELEQVLQTTTGDWWSRLHEATITDAATCASLVRIGLSIGRPDTVRASTEWANGAFIPVAEDGTPAAGRLLADVARRDLADYLDHSRLTVALDWVFVPESENEAPRFGSGASTLLVPDSPTRPVSRVVDLFYMPHAFVLPVAHPALGDRQSSFEFAGFLLALIEDVLNGRPIADRIQLQPLAADAAANLRRRLRSLLDKPHGVADQVMGMLRRVDIAEPTPPPDRRRALHWHAGNLLDTLETLSLGGAPSPERPSAAIRAMIIERPSLYAAARAIAILPFNTHVDRANDPAAAFNHDCFSPELLSIDVRKLLIGDDGQEAADTARFDLSALRGGTLGDRTYAYLIDVLPDRVYDDTVIIGQNRYQNIDPDDEDEWGLPRRADEIDVYAGEGASGALALRGEDMIDPPKSGEPRGIAANVVHAFPNWRVLQREAGGVSRKQAYYLLPERRMPPLARAVRVKTLSAGPDPSQSPIAVTLPDPAPGERLPRVRLRDQWPSAYCVATASLDAVQIATQGDEPARVYRRIRPASKPIDPATRALPFASVDGGQAKGWHLLTTVLANFYFAIELQKSHAKLVEQLDDDLYEIEVEMWLPAPPADPPDVPTVVPDQDDLLTAYRRVRSLKAGTDAGPKPTMTDDQLVTALKSWLTDPPAGAPYLGQRLLEAPSPMAPTLTRRFRIGRSAKASSWQIKTVGTNANSGEVDIDGALGHVVGFEILAQVPPASPQGPTYDAVVEDSERSAVIRLSVLDHPFHVTRARLRILRNWIDVDGDDQPDISPDFVLASGFSEWACEGRTPQRIDAALLDCSKVPEPGRELRVVPPGVPPETRMAEWIGKIDAGGDFDAGAALPAMLSVHVFIDEDDHDRCKSLWESEWMTHEGFNVSATVNRTLQDLGARHGKSAAVHPIPTREITTVRQICAPVPAGQIRKLLDGLRPADIMTLAAWTRLSWRETEGHSVLDVDVPITFKTS